MTLDDWRAWWARHGERELRCILMAAWDPIGVSYAPNAWDEYDGEVLKIGRLLYEARDNTAAAGQICAVLDAVQADLGFDGATAARPNREHALTIVAWYEWSFVRGGSVTPTER
jgi:hypothetical protein